MLRMKALLIGYGGRAFKRQYDKVQPDAVAGTLKNRMSVDKFPPNDRVAMMWVFYAFTNHTSIQASRFTLYAFTILLIGDARGASEFLTNDDHSKVIYALTKSFSALI